MKTRFAPSPTGYLHIGNLYSAYYCQSWAKQHNADIVLRIEDIDFTRCRPHFSQTILADMQWLGFAWHGNVLYQHTRMHAYQNALNTLKVKGLVYPCSCSRAQIKQSCEHAVQLHPEADPYLGTCRDQEAVNVTQSVAWRLNIHKAMQFLGQDLYWQDTVGYSHQVHAVEHGDVVLARKDIGVSYHLAVVVDDAYQHISHVIRGQDLRGTTGVHRILQALLALPTPKYLHHALLYADDQKKWSKKNKAPSLQDWRNQGWSAKDIKAYVCGLGDFHEH